MQLLLKMIILNILVLLYCSDCGNRNYTSEGFFDVIVTDPPYGIRAGAKKSGSYQLSIT